MDVSWRTKNETKEDIYDKTDNSEIYMIESLVGK